MPVRHYKDLIAYQKGYELVMLLYQMTKKFPKDEIFGMVSQIRRASVSVPSNIAEGYRRGGKDYAHFLKYSLGSSSEIETLLSLAKDLGYCFEHDFQKAYTLNEEVTKLLANYIKRLS